MPKQVHFWNTTEVARLALLYPDTPMQKITEELGRPKTAIYRKARENGLKRSPEFMFWNTTDVARLALLYPNTPMQKITEELGRPRTAIYRKAREIGLKRSPEFMASKHSGRMHKDNNRGLATRFKKRKAHNADSFTEREAQ